MNKRRTVRPVELKICGVTRAIDIVNCHDLGVDYVGFNFYQKSKRFIEPESAAALWQAFKQGHPEASLRPVAVTVDAGIDRLSQLLKIFPDLYALQLHGIESADFTSECCHELDVEIWKALGVGEKTAIEMIDEYLEICDRVILDSAAVAPGSDFPGGSGTMFSWDRFAYLLSRPDVGVAGGVNPENIAALLTYNPTLVDVATGAESAPGIKSKDKVEMLLTACRKLPQWLD